MKGIRSRKKNELIEMNKLTFLLKKINNITIIFEIS